MDRDGGHSTAAEQMQLHHFRPIWKIFPGTLASDTKLNATQVMFPDNLTFVLKEEGCSVSVAKCERLSCALWKNS